MIKSRNWHKVLKLILGLNNGPLSLSLPVVLIHIPISFVTVLFLILLLILLLLFLLPRVFIVVTVVFLFPFLLSGQLWIVELFVVVRVVICTGLLTTVEKEESSAVRYPCLN